MKERKKAIQPVPQKMRLEIVIEMQLELLNGGETLVHCKFKDFGI